jgi:lipoate-protein ligase A
MAVDESLLVSIGKGGSRPVLRLYAWQPACLSLGYAQLAKDIDKTLLASHQYEFVRRPTGGKAILHTDELTYAVIAPEEEPRLAGGVLESYLHLSQALLLALHLLGIEAQSKSSSTEPIPQNGRNPVCFEVPSQHEITFAGKKLIGSAQARKKEGVLQHGSLPLYGDLSRIIQVLAFHDENQRVAASQRLLQRATTVQECLGRKISWQTASQAFVAGFRQQLNMTFDISSLTNEEHARASDLVACKYGSPTWNERV